MTRIFKIGTTTITEDDSLRDLGIDEIREHLKASFPEVSNATVRETVDEENGITYVSFMAAPGRKG